MSTLLEQDEMGKMTPSAHPKKGKGKQAAVAHSSEEESEAEEAHPKVRGSGPSGQIVRVVLTSTKGKGKKLPTRKAKAVKSAAVVRTTDDEEEEIMEDTPSASEYEQRRRTRHTAPKEEDDIAPLIRAQKRAPKDTEKRKKEAVRYVTPPPEDAVEVSPCVNCVNYGNKCHFIPAPRQAGVAPTCHECRARKIRCFIHHPGVTPSGAEGSSSMPPSPRRALLIPRHRPWTAGRTAPSVQSGSRCPRAWLFSVKRTVGTPPLQPTPLEEQLADAVVGPSGAETSLQVAVPAGPVNVCAPNAQEDLRQPTAQFRHHKQRNRGISQVKVPPSRPKKLWSPQSRPPRSPNRPNCPPPATSRWQWTSTSPPGQRMTMAKALTRGPSAPSHLGAPTDDAEPEKEKEDVDQPVRPASPMPFSSEDEDQGSVSQPEGRKNPHETRSRSKQPFPERPESKKHAVGPPKSKGKRTATENAESTADEADPKPLPAKKKKGKAGRGEGPETILEDVELDLAPKTSKLKRKAEQEVDPEEGEEPLKKKTRQGGGGKGRGGGAGGAVRGRGAAVAK